MPQQDSETVKVLSAATDLGSNLTDAAGSVSMTNMNRSDAAKIARRGLLRVLAVGAAAATTSACASGEAAEFPDKRKARYQADSADVQSFYRVNRYPAK
jgi:hypothetical protein